MIKQINIFFLFLIIVNSSLSKSLKLGLHEMKSVYIPDVKGKLKGKVHVMKEKNSNKSQDYLAEFPSFAQVKALPTLDDLIRSEEDEVISGDHIRQEPNHMYPEETIIKPPRPSKPSYGIGTPVVREYKCIMP